MANINGIKWTSNLSYCAKSNSTIFCKIFEIIKVHGGWYRIEMIRTYMVLHYKNSSSINNWDPWTCDEWNHIDTPLHSSLYGPASTQLDLMKMADILQTIPSSAFYALNCNMHRQACPWCRIEVEKWSSLLQIMVLNMLEIITWTNEHIQWCILVTRDPFY